MSIKKKSLIGVLLAKGTTLHSIKRDTVDEVWEAFGILYEPRKLQQERSQVHLVRQQLDATALYHALQLQYQQKLDRIFAGTCTHPHTLGPVETVETTPWQNMQSQV